MRKGFLLASATFLLTCLLNAQAPQKINYQAIVRDVSGNALTGGTTVSLHFIIHDSSPTGTVVFQETTSAVTNQFGLITKEIGSAGNLSTVNWGNGAKYLQVETDVTGGSNFTDMGTSQLLSVPYALYSGNSAAGPMGPTGAQGIQGPTGIPGATGINGANGPTGDTGPQGVAGNDGATGPQGPTGNNGADGPTGATGPQGIAGNDGTTGPTGNDGAVGATGAQGVAGNDGATGPQGDTGTQGPTGNDGAAGATGAQGVAGNDGATGPQGPTGNNGADGATGAQGVAGNNGATGPQGNTGAQGATGNNGATGATGLLPNGTAAGNTTYWDGSTWRVDNNNIYNNGGNVGIGNSAPAAKLHVTPGNVILDLIDQQESGQITIQQGSLAGPGNWIVDGFYSFSGGNKFRIWNDATPAMFTFMDNGNLGIGNFAWNVQPTAALHVLGNVRFETLPGTGAYVGIDVSGNLSRVAGTNGITGPTGATGNNGNDGATGPTGATGNNGNNGATGPTGATGNNGNNGATGPTGATGNNGNDGATGPTGATGNNGNNGATGATGATGTATVTTSTYATNSTTILTYPTSITYTALPGLSHTFTAAAANTKVLITAWGTASKNSDFYTRVFAQYAIFVDGVSTGIIERIGIDQNEGGQYTEAPWSLSTVLTLAAGSHTITIRAAHAGGDGNSGTGNDAVWVCTPSGSVGDGHMNVIEFQ